MDTATSTGRISTTNRRDRWLLSAAGLVLEVAAVAAVLLDGRHLTWIAWLPGWAGLVLTLLHARSMRRIGIVAVVTAALFVLGTVLGIVAAVR